MVVGVSVLRSPVAPIGCSNDHRVRCEASSDWCKKKPHPDSCSCSWSWSVSWNSIDLCLNLGLKVIETGNWSKSWHFFASNLNQKQKTCFPSSSRHVLDSRRYWCSWIHCPSSIRRERTKTWKRWCLKKNTLGKKSGEKCSNSWNQFHCIVRKKMRNRKKIEKEFTQFQGVGRNLKKKKKVFGKKDNFSPFHLAKPGETWKTPAEREREREKGKRREVKEAEQPVC